MLQCHIFLFTSLLTGSNANKSPSKHHQSLLLSLPLINIFLSSTQHRMNNPRLAGPNFCEAESLQPGFLLMTTMPKVAIYPPAITHHPYPTSLSYISGLYHYNPGNIEMSLLMAPLHQKEMQSALKTSMRKLKLGSTNVTSLLLATITSSSMTLFQRSFHSLYNTRKTGYTCSRSAQSTYKIPLLSQS